MAVAVFLWRDFGVHQRESVSSTRHVSEWVLVSCFMQSVFMSIDDFLTFEQTPFFLTILGKSSLWWILIKSPPE
jgi:hypothetical protein